MTKFAELSRLPKNGEPCGMVKAYYEHVLQLGTLATFLEGFDFESRDEIQRAVIDLHYTIYGDPFMSNKKKRDNDPMLAMLYIKAEKLLVNEGRLDKLAVTLSGHPGAAAREPTRDSPVIAEMRAFVSCMA